MSTDPEMEMSRRRRIVYQGLKEHFPEAVVQQALDVLKTGFPASVPFSVHRFLQELSLLVELGPLRGALFGSFTRLGLLSLAQLGPDPEGPAHPPATPPTTKPAPPAPAKPPIYHRGRSVN